MSVDVAHKLTDVSTFSTWIHAMHPFPRKG